jgi:hypothetical protein
LFATHYPTRLKIHGFVGYIDLENRHLCNFCGNGVGFVLIRRGIVMDMSDGLALLQKKMGRARVVSNKHDSHDIRNTTHDDFHVS